LGEDCSALAFEGLMAKYEEALFMRDLDVGVMQEAIVRAFEGNE
jgi:hypothetical protein